MPCSRTGGCRSVLGLVLLTVGVALALDRLGVMALSQVVAFWPLVLVAIGASIMAGAVGRRQGGCRAGARTDTPGSVAHGPGDRT